jgi:hypothetical protein
MWESKGSYILLFLLWRRWVGGGHNSSGGASVKGVGKRPHRQQAGKKIPSSLNVPNKNGLLYFMKSLVCGGGLGRS